MALKITTQIGTNRGLTSEAYIRIGSYDLHKTGKLILGLQIYQNQTDATQPLGTTPIYKEAISLEIGSIFTIPLLKDVIIKVTKPMLVDEPSIITVPIIIDGKPAGTEEKEVIKKVMRETEVDETIKVSDMSIVEGQDIFEFGYRHLKTKLEELFGAENILDC